MFRKARRQFKISWFILPVLVLFTISGTLLLRRKQELLQNAKTTTSSAGLLVSLTSSRHVTKSLAELGPMDELNPYVVFFNWVPKCGSEMLILLIQWLQGRNNFKHVRLRALNKQRLTQMEEEQIVDEVTSTIRSHAVPLVFDRQLRFVNFSSFDRQSPTFMNLIRDPIEKIVSREKKTTAHVPEDCLKELSPKCTLKKSDLSIPYFCGYDPRCMLLNDKWALTTAKANVERYYAVVGVLHELNATLVVLEYKLPYFFRGAAQLYSKQILEPQMKLQQKKPTAAPVVKNHFKKQLKTEYEFYEWIKSRLFNQLHLATGSHPTH